MPLRLDNAKSVAHMPTAEQQQTKKDFKPRFKVDPAASPMPEIRLPERLATGRHQNRNAGRDHLGMLGEIKSEYPGEIVGIGILCTTMSRKLIPMAIAYDFDGTLAPGNIQENSFIPEIGMKKTSFWQQNKTRAERHEADEVLSYMTFMLERASAADVPVRRQDFARPGKTVPLFQGAADWFDRVNERARERHVKLQHYIISSGITEMIEAT